MSYYSLPEEEQKRLDSAGVDWSLIECLDYNPQSFSLTDIEKVLAVWEGENDGDDWRWVIRLKESSAKEGKRYIFLQGGCDYTGWDCQSWATSEYANTGEEAANMSLGDIPITDSQPYQAGLGHMLTILSGNYMNNVDKVLESLLDQLVHGKEETWQESMDEHLGTASIPKIGT